MAKAGPFAANRPPSRPKEALRLGQEGRVVLRVRIAAKGQVESTSLETSSGIAHLDRSAIQMVGGGRFEPARRRNVAVQYEVLAPSASPFGQNIRRCDL